MHVRLSLIDSVPPVTRDIAIDPSTSLDVVHLVIQRLFGWQNVHLHRFDSADPFERWRADAPEPRAWLLPSLLDEFDGEPDTDATLAEALAVGGGTLWYEYDFGDSWRLTITAIDGDDTPRCVLAAVGHPPRDDSGGVHSFNERRAARSAASEPVDIDSLNTSAQTLLAATRSLPRLRPLLTRVTTDVGSEWCARIAAAVQHPPIIDDAAIAASIRPIEWMLRRIGPDGTALTAAGWLPPAIVRDAMRELNWEHRDVGMMNREDRTFAIADLRALMRQLGLLRVAKGRIARTAVARRLVNDSRTLWQHVAEQLVARQPGAVDRDLMLLMALQLVSGEALDEHPLAERMARDLSALGWRDRGGNRPDELVHGRVTPATASNMLSWALQPLRDLGAYPEGERRRWQWGSEPTPVGRALGWAMLGGQLAQVDAT
ncbi:plasmid pRiA4b ORF-3 family protein [Microcella pacifica]|uniref:Plasmid pRiA4b ORF-3 family protein n=1 Tax=Microcella pacifica TaxID=2591847 RepID=A0A9E5MKA6_9MICO|nr:plasmid pRiA4b ORF-3 family protein [Microcella pacifica]NHF62386.1 plasmid pRiA4b ORF-3 family protein [Microcella pacifica]